MYAAVLLCVAHFLVTRASHILFFVSYQVVKFPVKPKASPKSTHPVAEARLKEEKLAREAKQMSSTERRMYAGNDQRPTFRKVRNLGVLLLANGAVLCV